MKVLQLKTYILGTAVFLVCQGARRGKTRFYLFNEAGEKILPSDEKHRVSPEAISNVHQRMWQEYMQKEKAGKYEEVQLINDPSTRKKIGNFISRKISRKIPGKKQNKNNTNNSQKYKNFNRKKRA